jgi:PAS domain S-box-containing protein
LQNIRVLLVDDDNNYFNLIQKMLARESQYQLEWASSYDQAREAATRAHYDVYLIDYRLEDRSGLDLLKELRALDVHAPVILMTSYADRDFDMQVLENGAADYIDKADLKPGILARMIRYTVQREVDHRALQESEERYRTLLENASDGILIVNAAGKISIANIAAGTLTGFAPDALLAREFSEFVSAADSSQPAFNVSLAEVNRPVILEQRIKRRDGSYVPVEISAKRARDGSVQCIIRDITHRKEVELEREKYVKRLTILRQIDEEINQMLSMDYVQALALDAAMRLSGARAGFIATMEDGRLTMSQAIGYYASMDKGGAMPPNPLYDRVVRSEVAQLLLDIQDMPDYEPPHADTHSQMVIPLMSYERLLGLLNLETNRDDRFNDEIFEFIKLIAARVAIAMENAQLYQIAQDQLAQMQELFRQVSELEQLKTDMIRIAAHDLRNPVGVIVGYLELLEWSLEGKLTDKQHGQIQAMMRAAQRMEKITTDILSLERIEKLRLDQTQTIDLNEVVNETFEEYNGQARQKKQEITLDVSAQPLVVQGDHAQIREAVANLVGNAIKYTAEGGTIRVITQQVDSCAEFKVIDTGFGIPEEQQTGLFQPFFRAASDETANIEGTGLGLHLVKNIVDRHEGKMIFNSVYGEGSTFGFSLPLAES